MQLHVESFDIAGMIEEMVTTLRPAIAKNANTYQLRMPEEIGTMRGDVTKVRQILLNLLSNACKFTDHGTVSLDVDRVSAAGQDWIRFRVGDTGIGISAEQQENLFQEFTQADISISRKYGGTGLGLAISHRFVQLMKGQINVESEPGQGAIFTVQLPAQVVIETNESAPSEGTGDASATISANKTNLDTLMVIV